MKRLRYSMIGVVFIAALAGALFGVNRVGLALKHQAVENWLDKANNECQRITDTSLGWFSLFHAQLRGLASLFYGSEIVTENEFLNSLGLIEGVELEAMIPLDVGGLYRAAIVRQAAGKRHFLGRFVSGYDELRRRRSAGARQRP